MSDPPTWLIALALLAGIVGSVACLALTVRGLIELVRVFFGGGHMSEPELWTRCPEAGCRKTRSRSWLTGLTR